VQPEFPTDFFGTRTPYDSAFVDGKLYSFNTTTHTNSSRIASFWFETPDTEPIGTQVNGNDTVGRSSAYLNIQVPDSNSTAGILLSCSVDARWLRTPIVGRGAAEKSADIIYQSDPLIAKDPDVFPADNSGAWRPVRLGIDWLNALTTAIGSEIGWNSPSATLAGTRLFARQSGRSGVRESVLIRVLQSRTCSGERSPTFTQDWLATRSSGPGYDDPCHWRTRGSCPPPPSCYSPGPCWGI
jgi:hypothetical protein